MGYNYVPRLTDVGLLTSPYYNQPPNPFTPLRIRYYNNNPHRGECTTYAYGRWLEIANGDVSKLAGLLDRKNLTNGTRNGGAWYQASSPTIRAGKSNPQPGDIFCLLKANSGTHWYGHVGVVEEVHFDYFISSESEHSGKPFNTVTRMKSLEYTGHYPRNYYQRNDYHLEGFLRMSDIPSPGGVPDYDMPVEWVVKPHYYDMSQEDKENNAVMAAVQLKSLGWTLEAIAGALGNFDSESWIDPQSTGTGGGGLVGWTPLTIYTRWSDYYGYTWYDGEKQIEFIAMNVYCSGIGQDGPILQPQWQTRPSLGINVTFDEYITLTETPEEMGRYFMLCYERPLDQSAAAQAYRAGKAREWYDFLLGINLEDPKRPYVIPMPVWMMAGNAKPKLIY